ncbi:hypothetical protein T36_2037 [Helicobacter cinaedi]|uniref:type II secretion system protein n=1 Tax=Helicobacter cinaedi TaxID=213 RepID=UPI001F2BC680|nr:hypothetical protein [Helicobacter cinaedi]BDB65558.1 hypothetical protein T36_2037 [Helicobacter cinaedi]
MFFKSKRSAFSLFEVSVGIVILGIIGLVCSSMLLDISKHIAYTQAKNDSTALTALLKIENLLESAIIESLQDSNGKALSAPSSHISFYTIQQDLLFGGGDKNVQSLMQGNTLLPKLSIEILHSYQNTLNLAPLTSNTSNHNSTSWLNGMSAYLISKPQGDFTPFRITAISGNTLTLDKPTTHTPLAILPITHHTLSAYDNALWLDSVPFIYDVESFEITPLSFSQGILLEIRLCVKTPNKPFCQTRSIWLDSIVEFL